MNDKDIDAESFKANKGFTNKLPQQPPHSSYDIWFQSELKEHLVRNDMYDTEEHEEDIRSCNKEITKHIQGVQTKYNPTQIPNVPGKLPKASRGYQLFRERKAVIKAYNDEIEVGKAAIMEKYETKWYYESYMEFVLSEHLLDESFYDEKDKECIRSWDKEITKLIQGVEAKYNPEQNPNFQGNRAYHDEIEVGKAAIIEI